ncbi:hypothetical protein [Ferrimonas pelagia]|uniref:Uncharacterized protein n=1 Tax=Ferrimonas pelagia TaxID=1177826 RepID=A0ABP9EML8_9GAMM
MMLKSRAATLLLSLCAFTGHATPLLEFLPVCQQEIIDLHQSQTLAGDAAQTELHRLPEFNQAVIELQAQTDALGFDAFYLNSALVRESRHEIDAGPKSIRRRYSKPTLTLQLAAKAVRFCQDNASLSSNPTPLNAQGRRVLANTRKIILATPAKALPTTPDALLNFDGRLELSQGLLGVLPGASRQQVLEHLGQPSMKIPLEDEHHLWGYGRRYWLTFEQDRLVQINTDPAPVKVSTLNLIDAHPQLSEADWQFQGVDLLRLQWEQAQQHLSELQFDSDAAQAHIELPHYRLTLKFETFHQHSKDRPTRQLTGFAFEQQPPTEQAPMSLTSPEYGALVAQIISGQPPLSLARFNQAFPNAYALHSKNGKQRCILGQNAIVGFEEGALTQLTLVPAMFHGGEATDVFSQMINAAGLKMTRAQTLAAFPDAFDLLDQINIEQANGTIETYFDGDHDSAELYQADITLF